MKDAREAKQYARYLLKQMGVNIRQTDIVKKNNATTVKRKDYVRPTCDETVACGW